MVLECSVVELGPAGRVLLSQSLAPGQASILSLAIFFLSQPRLYHGHFLPSFFEVGGYKRKKKTTLPNFAGWRQFLSVLFFWF